MTRFLTFFVVFFLCACGSLACAADPAISFTFYDFPPKMVIRDGKMSGERYDEMNRIAQKAGFQVNWIRTSMGQEGNMLNKGQRAFCTTGRAYTEDRYRRWKFVPYQLDHLPKRVIVTREALADRVRAHKNAHSVMSDSSLRAAMVSNFVYSDAINKILQEKPPWVVMRANDVFQVIDMVLHGRADYTIVPGHNWEAFKASRQAVKSLIALPATGTGEARQLFIVCSNATPSGTIEALGATMKEMGYPKIDLGH